MESGSFILEEFEKVFDAHDRVIGLVSHPYTHLQGRAHWKIELFKLAEMFRHVRRANEDKHGISGTSIQEIKILQTIKRVAKYMAVSSNGNSHYLSSV